jgi:hypothetical protein
MSMTATRTEDESAEFVVNALKLIDATTDTTFERFDVASPLNRAAAKAIRKDLRALGERAAGGVDDDLVVDLCRALGVTMAYFAAESDEDEHWVDRFVIESLDDVAATVHSFRGPGLYDITGNSVVLRLRAAGALSLSDIGDCEHLGDLLIGTAAAIAHVVVPRAA